MANPDYREDVVRQSGAYPTLLRAWNHPLRPSSQRTIVYVVIRATGLRANIETGTARSPGAAAQQPVAPVLRRWRVPHHDIQDMQELGSGDVLFVREARDDRPEDDMFLLQP